MPVIRISSLPFGQATDIPVVLRNVCATLSEVFAIEEEHITLSWSYFQPGHLIVGGVPAETQASDHRPLLVDILVPDFNSPESLEHILVTVAEVISKSVRVALDNIFIHIATAHSGAVFDHGSVIEWPAIEGGIQMTDRTERSGNERRTDEDRRSANVPNSTPEERRTGTERRSGEDRRKK